MYRLPMPLHDAVFALRRQVLNRVLLVTAVGSVIYLLLGLTPWFGSKLFPWDGIALFALAAICYGLSRIPNWGHMVAASIFIAGATQPIAFSSQIYGILHPVNALYLAGIVLCGLLVGDWFVIAWTGLYAFFIALWGYGEWRGDYLSPTTLIEFSDLLYAVGTWWLLLLLTAWLTRFLTQNMEIALVSARTQADTLDRTMQALTESSDLSIMLSEVFSYIVSRLNADQATLWLVEDDEIRPRLFYMDKQTIPAGSRPIPVEHVENWSQIRATTQKSFGEKTVVHFPLRDQEQILGYISVTQLRGQPITTTELDLLQRLVQQVTLAARLERLSERAEDAAVLHERNRLAREIHDTLAQGFTGIVIQLEAAEELLLDEPDEAQGHLARARQLARDSLVEARRSVQALRPLALEQNDLPAALRKMCDQLTSSVQLKAGVRVEGEVFALPADLAADLLRIGQESVTNALRHSNAQSFLLQLNYRPGEIELRAEDDGVGFDTTAAPAGYGLVGMRERVGKYNGELELHSQRGSGTIISATIPIP